MWKISILKRQLRLKWNCDIGCEVRVRNIPGSGAVIQCVINRLQWLASIMLHISRLRVGHPCLRLHTPYTLHQQSYDNYPQSASDCIGWRTFGLACWHAQADLLVISFSAACSTIISLEEVRGTAAAFKMIHLKVPAVVRSATDEESFCSACP